MTINARDVIAQPIIGWLRAPVARLVADHIVSALMEAAGVEPGGRLVIEHADGWPLGRLYPHGSWLTKRNADGTLHCNHGDRDFCTVPDHTTEITYRVVAP